MDRSRGHRKPNLHCISGGMIVSIPQKEPERDLRLFRFSDGEGYFLAFSIAQTFR